MVVFISYIFIISLPRKNKNRQSFAELQDKNDLGREIPKRFSPFALQNFTGFCIYI